jgi:peptidyl-prolyl cis-trans isomerase SDCCAG10
VIIKTTLGEIEIELWSKECPKTCRNFVQLCLEGYFDGNIFHRIVKDFIAQTGDPTGTGQGGESIYGEPFKVILTV